jgi:DNA-binding NarL/FixJ family response regulator
VIRVLIADDQALIRSGLRTVLEHEQDIEVVGEAANGRDAVTESARLAPDVVLMDIRMPGIDGLAATRQLMASARPPRVLILTTYDLDEYVYDGLKAGASGFLLKDAEQELIVRGVRTVASGDSILAPSLTLRLIESFVTAPGPASTPAGQLSARESEVLREMARGLSNAEIGRALYLSEATVKTHVASILAKLGLRDRLQAVVLAYETGMVRPGRQGSPRHG